MKNLDNMIQNTFGSNNYSHGMIAVTIKPEFSKEEILEAGLFLHPTVEPNSYETFGLQGTQEQFDKFYQSAVDSYCAKRAVRELGMPHYSDRKAWSKVNKRAKELSKNFIPWYDEESKKES